MARRIPSERVDEDVDVGQDHVNLPWVTGSDRNANPDPALGVPLIGWINQRRDDPWSEGSPPVTSGVYGQEDVDGADNLVRLRRRVVSGRLGGGDNLLLGHPAQLTSN